MARLVAFERSVILPSESAPKLARFGGVQYLAIRGHQLMTKPFHRFCRGKGVMMPAGGKRFGM
jgi:hypothetical protein